MTTEDAAQLTGDAVVDGAIAAAARIMSARVDGGES